MTPKHRLVILTAQFPYGKMQEPFLETEIEVLAQRFDRIYVLPSSRRDGFRTLPPNVELVEMHWAEPSKAARLRALASPGVGRVLALTLRAGADPRPYVRSSRLYADILARNLLKLASLARFVRDRTLGGAIFYDYWFENSTLALALLRRSGLIRTAVSRGHRFDIYDECWSGGTAPFREVKAMGLDMVFVVSEFGRAYLERRLPAAAGKLQVARLGVLDPGRTSPPPTDGIPVIATCARLEAFKCVHLVPQVLAELKRPVRWVHLGDGPERARVLAEASRLGPEVRWELRGQLENREVRRFYREHHVDLFLSLSGSEGLPVSMMEAQSYGIPVVARGVHGVPEIVTKESGILLAADASPREAAEAVQDCLHNGRFPREQVRTCFRQRFDASVNYNLFADALIALQESQAAAA